MLSLDKAQQLKELEVKAGVTSLFAERVSMYRRSLKGWLLTATSLTTFGILSWFYAPVANSVYVQQIENFSFGIRLAVSIMNLSLVVVATFILFALLYNVYKLMINILLFNKGKFYYRTDKTYAKLVAVVENEAYADMFLKFRGSLSRVSVPIFYARQFEIESLVPVILETMFLNKSERVHHVKECVGSRALTEREYYIELQDHFGQVSLRTKDVRVKKVSDQYLKALQTTGSIQLSNENKRLAGE